MTNPTFNTKDSTKNLKSDHINKTSLDKLKYRKQRKTIKQTKKVRDE